MTRRLVAACVLLTAGSLLAGCADDPAPPPSAEPITTRGLYLGTVYDSAAAVVSHEAIPGLMEAMRMQIRVADRAELRGLREGEKIRFTLTDPDGSGYRMSDIAELPPDTPLDLADFGPEAVDGDTVGR